MTRPRPRHPPHPRIFTSHHYDPVLRWVNSYPNLPSGSEGNLSTRVPYQLPMNPGPVPVLSGSPRFLDQQIPDPYWPIFMLNHTFSMPANPLPTSLCIQNNHWMLSMHLPLRPIQIRRVPAAVWVTLGPFQARHGQSQPMISEVFQTRHGVL